MEIISDLRLLPAHGGEPDQIVVLLEGRKADDRGMNWVAHRWRDHLGNALFAIPKVEMPDIRDEQAFAQTSAALEHYVAALRAEFGVENDRLVLVGFAEGASLAFHNGLRHQDALLSIVGFSGELAGFGDVGTETASRPPVFLVSGENDDVVSPRAFLDSFQRLQAAGIPVYTCFRPGLGRTIDNFGADAAMFFLQGVIAAKGPPAPRRVKPPKDVAKSIKLVIWDLDETLWQGTLDDETSLHLSEFRMNAIRRLNGSGIVSAICSKNDFDTARRKLEEFGIWDDFVFPRIAFAPKGAAIKSLIDDMQLKAKNCIFIDDNDLNLAEAKAVLPDLHTLDAKSDECDAFLQRLMDAHADVTKSRVEEYRSLQNRVVESQSFEGGREDFLQSCDIHVSFASSADLVDFAPRLEELINRTNQLNYLKTRVQPGSMVEFVSEPSRREGFALFAWDKFGYHGLVGFIGVDVRTETILHMAFSCRIMHMGMENALLARAAQRFRKLVIPQSIAIKPEIPGWITEEAFSAPEIRTRIYAEERNIDEGTRDVKIRFMADCQSGVFAHFSGLRDVAEIDSHPRKFILCLVLNQVFLSQSFPPALVYFVGGDYFNSMWPESVRHLLSEPALYDYCANEFCNYVQSNGKRLLIIGTPRNLPEHLYSPEAGVTPERAETFQDIWRKMASIYDCVDILDVDAFLDANRMVDVTHFKVDASREIALEIAKWFESLPASLFEERLARAG